MDVCQIHFRRISPKGFLFFACRTTKWEEETQIFCGSMPQESTIGLEPIICWLQISCSTNWASFYTDPPINESHGENGIRTHAPRRATVFKTVSVPLRYLSKCGTPDAETFRLNRFYTDPPTRRVNSPYWIWTSEMQGSKPCAFPLG